MRRKPGETDAHFAGRLLQAQRKPESKKGGRNGGRPKEHPRCPCGENKLTRAKARNFGCCKKAGKL
jgi:hypothetical protein